MDFESVLHKAQQNEQSTRRGNWYRTSFSPPKKMQKEKKLSDNIKNFLARKEEEERLKHLEERRKKEGLLALRKQDKKSTRRVQTMLKLTKSANKSVLEDAKDYVNTAVTAAGPLQPDEDDYGYVSVEAAKLYDQLINKYSNIEPQKSSSTKRLQKSSHEISNTKDRVKAAIQRDEDDKLQPRKRKRKDKASELYDYGDSDNYKGEEAASESSDTSRKKTAVRKNVPSNTLDFQSLLKVAEKKQHEPVVIEKKVLDDARPMTQKEKMEYLREQERKRNNQHKLIKNNYNKGENSKRIQNDSIDRKHKQYTEVNVKNKSNEKRISGNMEKREKLDMRSVEDKLRKDSGVWSAPCNRSRPLKQNEGYHSKNDQTDARRPYTSEILKKTRDVDNDISSYKRNSYDGRREILESSRNKSFHNGHMNRDNVLLEGDRRKDSQQHPTRMQNSNLYMRDRERCNNSNKMRFSERDNNRDSETHSNNDDMIRRNERIAANPKRSSNSNIRYGGKSIDNTKNRDNTNEILRSSDKKHDITKLKYNDRNDNERIKRYSMEENDAKKVYKRDSTDNISIGNYKLQKHAVERSRHSEYPNFSSKATTNTSVNSNSAIDSCKVFSNNPNERNVRETRETSVEKRIHRLESARKVYDMKEKSRLSNHYQKSSLKIGGEHGADALSRIKQSVKGVAERTEKPKSSMSIVNGKLRQHNPLSTSVKSRQFPPDDVRRIKRHMKRPAAIASDSEYDSEMDSFIDDNEDDTEDYSKYISEIFGYDRTKYRNMDDDDECMESNFAQLQKEEFESTKLGILEDLADIRREKTQQKRLTNRRK